MSNYNVNPTRMERTRQRGRLKTATRAHKLLKDKYDEMVRTFSRLIKANKTLRLSLEEELKKALSLFMAARTKMTMQEIDDALSLIKQTASFNYTTQNIMGLVVPHIQFTEDKTTPLPVFASTPATFDKSVSSMHKLSATIIDLADIEKTCGMLADEIEKVRRRINSLEYIMIPSIKENIKFITMKLEENQRENQIRIMKIKDLQKQDSLFK